MTEHIQSSLLPGCTIYMTSFGSLNEIYIRKLEDHTAEFDTFLDTVNNYCSSGIVFIYILIEVKLFVLNIYICVHIFSITN